MGWLMSEVAWLWSTFGIFGVTFVAVSTFALILIILQIFRASARTWRTRVGLIVLAISIIGLLVGGVLIAGGKGAATETSPLGASGSSPSGATGSGPAPGTTAGNWNENAVLQLAFDNELQQATSLKQEGVTYYYWTHIPGVAVNFENRQIQTGIGYIMIFLALKDPTHTNYSRARVLGGGIHTEILGTHPTGAMVRLMGDMRGRTVEIRFSKNPIPLD